MFGGLRELVHDAQEPQGDRHFGNSRAAETDIQLRGLRAKGARPADDWQPP